MSFLVTRTNANDRDYTVALVDTFQEFCEIVTNFYRLYAHFYAVHKQIKQAARTTPPQMYCRCVLYWLFVHKSKIYGFLFS